MIVAHHRQTPTVGVDRPSPVRPGRLRRRSGYVAAIVVQLIGLYLVRHLVDWDVPFLTSRFDRVVPSIELSILVTLAANAAWLVLDPPWFRSVIQIGVNLVGLAPIVRMWQIFPFDLGADDRIWRLVLRALLVVAFAGTVVGTGAELARLARSGRGAGRSAA
ncbi:MAG: hypothetical protein R2761_04015 [Acidimicrobiales bacterium]